MCTASITFNQFQPRKQLNPLPSVSAANRRYRNCRKCWEKVEETSENILPINNKFLFTSFSIYNLEAPAEYRKKKNLHSVHFFWPSSSCLSFSLGTRHVAQKGHNNHFLPYLSASTSSSPLPRKNSSPVFGSLREIGWRNHESHVQQVKLGIDNQTLLIHNSTWTAAGQESHQSQTWLDLAGTQKTV